MELTQTKEALELALVKSESLQDTYKKVLEQGIDADQSAKPSDIGITFEGSSEVEKTKEFDLYQSDLGLRRQLVEIERELLDKQYIIEMISNKQDSGFASTTRTFLGIELNTTMFLGVLAFLVALAIMFGIEFLKFIEKFKMSV